MDITASGKTWELAESILSRAKKMGASSADFSVNINNGFSVNVRKGEPEIIESTKTKNVEITVYFGNHFGTASCTDLNPKIITTVLEKACYIAKYTEEDPCIGLADKNLMACDYHDLDLNHAWPISIDQAIEIAKNCEKQGLNFDPKITNTDGASVNTSKNFLLYANTHGFCGTINSTKHSISCSLIAEYLKEMQRDDYYSLACDPKDLENFEEIANKTAKRTIDRLGAQKINTQKCPVIFISEIAFSLISNFVNAIHGANIYKNSSFLLDHLEQQVFAKNINIVEDPLISKGLNSSPFDAEGVKLAKTDLVVDGVLQRYLLDSYSARKLNMRTTGNAGGIHNLVVKTNPLDLKSMLKNMGTGLLVTELMGGDVNIVNGDYSRGVFGYWIKNGEIQYPVTGITIANNLKNMFLGIQEISNDIDYRRNILTGSILINEMTIAGY